MLLVVAALHEEVAMLLRVLQRDATHLVNGLARSACFSYELRAHNNTRPTFALFEMHAHGQKLRIAVLITGVGKVAAASAVSAACALYAPQVLICIGCALDLAQGTQRDETKPIPYALACVATTLQHDVNCVHMPRVKIREGATTRYKKCRYGEFVHASTEQHSDAHVYNAVLPIARNCARVHESAFYERVALLSGDVFVPHAKPLLMPESVRVTATRMAEHHSAVLLDMESAAVFHAAACFKVPSMACAVVLDSVAEPRPCSFFKAMPRVSHILSDLVLQILENSDFARL